MITEEHAISEVSIFFSSLEKNPRLKQKNVFLLISLGFEKSGANLEGNARFVADQIRQGSFTLHGKQYPVTQQDLEAFDPQHFESEAFQLMEIMHRNAGVNEPKHFARLDYERKSALPAGLYRRVKSLVLDELSKNTEVNYGETS